MATRNLLFKREYVINDHIKVMIPTVADVLENEDSYYGSVSMLTAMPIDMMVQLDDIGIDFSTINEWDLFLLLMPSLKKQDTSLIFGDLDLTRFAPALDPQSNSIIMIDPATGARIDRLILNRIAWVLRKVNYLEQNNRKPGNREAKEYMIQRMRSKMRRDKKREYDSQLENLIIAAVNSEQYHYGFEGTRELSIYQFNASVRQVMKKNDYNNKMFGLYSGTIRAKDLRQDDFNFLIQK